MLHPQKDDGAALTDQGHADRIDQARRVLNRAIRHAMNSGLDVLADVGSGGKIRDTDVPRIDTFVTRRLEPTKDDDVQRAR